MSDRSSDDADSLIRQMIDNDPPPAPPKTDDLIERARREAETN